ncbi:hypothetical protein B0H14DRAFT_530733 [Mycena olivaceomarginata]|nr:hypothetical protein B0H14DRAFT_530733 [Mycena olivaceomarginata]
MSPSRRFHSRAIVRSCTSYNPSCAVGVHARCSFPVSAPCNSYPPRSSECRGSFELTTVYPARLHAHFAFIFYLITSLLTSFTSTSFRVAVHPFLSFEPSRGRSQCSPHCGRVGWTAGRLPSTLYSRTYLIVHRSSDRFFVSYVHMAKYDPFTPEPPRPTRPVTRVPQRGYVASEHNTPELHFIALTESLRPPPVPHAHTAYLRFPIRFSFHAYTTFPGSFTHFLVHPHTPYLGRPTHLSVYRQRTLFFLSGIDNAEEHTTSFT